MDSQAASKLQKSARILSAFRRTTAHQPGPAALLVGNPAWASLPFFLSGGIKIVYDLLLYRSFVTHKPPEEAAK